MKIAANYSHLNGLEWMQVHKPQLWKEINQVIKSIDAKKHKTKKSEEKTMKGKMVYAPDSINKDFDTKFSGKGWQAQGRNYFYCSSDPEINKQLLKLPYEDQKEFSKNNPKLDLVRSFNSKDFEKERVAIEVQMGKYFAVQFDIFIKHADDYMNDRIDLGIEIVPMKSMEKDMSSGPPYFEKHLHEMQRQGRIFPPVPLILIGITP